MLELSKGILSIEGIQKALEREKYVADKSIATSIYLALSLGKPLLIEGEPGCGKTEIAKVLRNILDTDLIRLQCYEGLDANTSLYEWDYLRQLLRIRLEENIKKPEEIEEGIFSEEYLLKRPLLKAVLHEGPKPAVLLIDEVDRADEEFEGFLLEFLAEFQVTIPEIGTLKAKTIPLVVITSNRTRELGDGLRRRCLYLYVDYPSFEKELKILKLKTPNLSDKLAREVCNFVEEMRELDDLVKKPGVSETLDWASALVVLNRDSLDEKTVQETLSCIVKHASDTRRLSGDKLTALLQSSKATGTEG